MQLIFREIAVPGIVTTPHLHLICWIPVETGLLGPDGRSLPHHVVHDVEVPDSRARGEITNPREVFVPPLYGDTVHLPCEHPAQFGSDALQDALFPIRRQLL